MNDLMQRDPESKSTMYMLLHVLSSNNRNKELEEVAKQLLRADPNDEHVLDMLLYTKSQNHWSMIPLRPLQKYGWGASIAIWVGAIVGFRALDHLGMDSIAGPIALIFIAYVIYSWVWPSLLTRWMMRRK